MTDDIILEEQVILSDEDEGLTADDFAAGNFVSNPSNIGSEIQLTVYGVKKNVNTVGTKKDGSTFVNGLQPKDKTKPAMRYDLETDMGLYTVKSWEIFFKLLGRKDPKGVLLQYADKHNKLFKGAKISIKRLVKGNHATIPIPDLMMITGKNEAETKAYQAEVVKAKSESRCFEVKLLN